MKRLLLTPALLCLVFAAIPRASAAQDVQLTIRFISSASDPKACDAVTSMPTQPVASGQYITWYLTLDDYSWCTVFDPTQVRLHFNAAHIVDDANGMPGQDVNGTTAWVVRGKVTANPGSGKQRKYRYKVYFGKHQAQDPEIDVSGTNMQGRH